MSRRLDLPIAALAWLSGFAWVQWKGSWTPLAALAVLAAVRLVLIDPETRRLLLPRASAGSLAAPGALVMIGGTYGLYAALVEVVPSLADATSGLYGVLNAGGYGPLALATQVVAIAACEEVVWRGRNLEPPPARGAVDAAAARRAALLALLYGACHATSGSLLLVLVAAACGLAWGLLRIAGRSLWPAILVHAAWDLAVLVVWPLV